MSKEKHSQNYKSKIKSVTDFMFGGLFSKNKSFDKELSELMYDVQKNHTYSDDKLFVDLVPRYSTHQIRNEYLLTKDSPNFNLSDFLNRNFYKLDLGKSAHQANSKMKPREYIKSLWGELQRSVSLDQGSLIALPNAYVVPGGRFNEQFYWDSYFIMLGLAADEEWDLLEGMIKNVTYMIDRFGFIPTANRTYFLSRSQPPFFSRMVILLAKHKGESVLSRYLPYLLSEYKFWMKGSDILMKSDKKTFDRTVKMPNGAILNRYYDNMMTPRPESISKDLQIATEVVWRKHDQLYLNIRSAAESGWDFSSRWFDDPMDIHTIQTTDIIPIDLNCLLYELEILIAKVYTLIDNQVLADEFIKLSSLRVGALRLYCWDESKGFFFDYNFLKRQTTDRFTLASIFPLYSKIASDQQAALIASHIKNDFLKTGGLATTLIETGQQWDGSNGWAPLQWIAIEGLRNYGYNKLADDIKRRWIKTNLNILAKNSGLIEKYNVKNPNQPGGGGEYQLQIGFGWTNGVLAALLQEDKPVSS